MKTPKQPFKVNHCNNNKKNFLPALAYEGLERLKVHSVCWYQAGIKPVDNYYQRQM